MQLKLAEYKDGKFERFLELGEDFVYGGHFIKVDESEKARSERERFNRENKENITQLYWGILQKDEKDPLNRFDGLFDGRTYGEGRFVLMKFHEFFQNCDDAVYSAMRQKTFFGEKEEFITVLGSEQKLKTYGVVSDDVCIGNLHENPELWEKVK